MDWTPTTMDLGRRYVKLLADSYEAVVSVDLVMSYSSSSLAHRLQVVLEQDTSNSEVRLECNAEELKEVVSVLRQGSRYRPPQDNPRLVDSLRHTLDFLGLPAPHFPCNSSNEVLLLPAYADDARLATAVHHVNADGDFERPGLLLYSASTQGWADSQFTKDPMPRHVWPILDEVAHQRWLAAVVPSEYTNAGEDLVFMLPKDCSRWEDWKSAPVLLRASLKSSSFAAPPKHTNCIDSALAAAEGKLFLLGGHLAGAHADNDDEDHRAAKPDPSRMEVFDPHTGMWYVASSPLPEQSGLGRHALVAHQGRGALLLLGGEATGVGAAAAWASNSVAMYNIRAGSWSKNPSGCMLPEAPGIRDGSSIAAVAADEHTIMLLRSPAVQEDLDQEVMQPPGRVDLLDLRMWRWRQGAALQRDCLHGVGLVEYDGKLLALGGCREAWALEQDDRSEALEATDVVSCYNLRDDSWSEHPSRLPLALSQACPVVVRMPGVQL